MHVDARLELPPDLRSPGDARRFVSRTLAPQLGREDVETAALVTSELVTNAVLHTSRGCVLELLGDGEVLTVKVSDGERRSPRRDELSLGRGLRLLEVLSRRWGVTPLPTGKTVWAELRVHPKR